MLSIVDKLFTLASHSNTVLHDNHEWITQNKQEEHWDTYHRVWKTGGLQKLHRRLTRHHVNEAVSALTSQGHVFDQLTSGAVTSTQFRLDQIHAICENIGIPSLHDLNPDKKAAVCYLFNLKGGVGKSVVLSTLAHGLVLHDPLISLRLRVLVIDLDPQSSASLFLHHEASIGDEVNTAALAMISERTQDELLKDFVQKTAIPNVDIIPAAIADGFMAGSLERFAREQGVSSTTLLLDRVIRPLEDLYDVILIDTGPHLDSFMLNAVRAAQNLFIPMTPVSVDFDSSLRFMMRLPEIVSHAYELDNQVDLEYLSEMRLQSCIGFMSKFVDTDSAKSSRKLIRHIFGADFLRECLPDIVPFRKCGDTYDTVFSVPPSAYKGDTSGSLKTAIHAAQSFSSSVFDELAVSHEWKLERIRG
ncbi:MULTISPECIES: ParA family protein [Aeromonas]|uniref:ParA family protein n=1 Tax=Aeromonas veronii TaxID=654 RepID=A0A4S5CGT1_AERVE|nr:MULTISPECIES: ParA family protein [Aeromonas]THJ43681.1 ParA family protein [Aeromonas veronii]